MKRLMGGEKSKKSAGSIPSEVCEIGEIVVKSAGIVPSEVKWPVWKTAGSIRPRGNVLFFRR